VRLTGLTDGAAFVPEIEASLGYGPAAADPSTWDEGVWQPATWNPFVTGDYDEYYAAVTASAGTFVVASRFRLPGEAWVYGDRDGGAYTSGQAPPLSVSAAAESSGNTPGWCGVVTGSVSVHVDAFGGVTSLLASEVWESGLTDSGGWGQGIAAQVGWGTGDASSWPSDHWVSAGYRSDVNNNDRYEAVIYFPADTTLGDYTYGFRASSDGGVTWRACDDPQGLTLEND
jgi:hypothetical protein